MNEGLVTFGAIVTILWGLLVAGWMLDIRRHLKAISRNIELMAGNVVRTQRIEEAAARSRRARGLEIGDIDMVLDTKAASGTKAGPKAS